MAFYSQFNLYSWQDKVGFGGRVVPRKRKVNPRGVTFARPTGLIQFSSLVDEDAEAVKQKAQEEQREERELSKCRGKTVQQRSSMRSALVMDEL